MLLPLISFSALEFWTSASVNMAFCDLSLEGRKLTRLPAGFCIETNRVFLKDLAMEYGFSLPLQVMADSPKDRRFSKMLQCRIRSKNQPEKTFIKIDAMIFVACPELCFLQIAKDLSIPKLVEAGKRVSKKPGRLPNMSWRCFHYIWVDMAFQNLL